MCFADKKYAVFKNSFFWFFLLFALSSFVMFYQLGSRSLYNPDEGRYAQIAKEMVKSNNWIEPTLYGVDYHAKPVMFYWLTSLSYKIFGMNEFSSRFIPAFFGMLGILITFLFVKSVVGGREAVFSSFLLMANFWYVQVSRFMLIDAVFAFFIFACLYCFYTGYGSRSHKLLFYNLFYVILAFSFLTKGFACFILTSVPIFVYLFYKKSFRIGFKIHNHIWGISLFVFIVGIWLVNISVREPEFLWNFIWHDHIERFLSKDYEHQRSFFFFFLLTPLFLLPALFFIEPVIDTFKNWKNGHKDLKVYCLICAGWVILFFSLSRTKLPTYILPAFPFLCIALGLAWSELTQKEPAEKVSLRLWKGGLVLILIVGISAIVAAVFFDHLFERKFPIENELIAAGLFVILFAVLGIIFLKKKNLSGIFCSFVIMMTLVYVPVNSAIDKVNLNYTTRPFAEKLNILLEREDKVYLYGSIGNFYDFQFYLNHPVYLVGLTGELEKVVDNDDKVYLITPEKFNNLLSSDEKFYILTRKKYYKDFDPIIKEHMKVVVENIDKVLLKK